MKPSNIFEGAFTKSLLREARDEAEAPAPSDAEAFENQLEPDTDPAAFDVAPGPDVNISAEGVRAAREWILRIEEFSEFINGLSSTSLNAQINKLDMQTPVFRGVVRTQQKRITKVAEDLAALSEVFKSIILGAEKKITDSSKQ